MAPSDVPLYYQTIRRLGQTYKTDIQVKAGLEIDYDPLKRQPRKSKK
ncbi:MAG: hypothetical protein R2861_16570 [Desulfobacterales bacterium]